MDGGEGCRETGIQIGRQAGTKASKQADRKAKKEEGTGEASCQAKKHASKEGGTPSFRRGEMGVQQLTPTPAPGRLPPTGPPNNSRLWGPSS